MTLINCIEESEATGEIKQIFDRWRSANPDRTEFLAILKCFGAAGSPEVLQGLMAFCYPLQFTDGQIGRRMKEMIGAYVSGLNQCPY